MTIFRRAASFAAMTLSLAGLFVSAPSHAGEIDRGAVVPALVATPAPIAPDPSVRPDAATDPATLRPATFGSLDAAIAAQDMTSDEDARCLAGAVYFEAKGEPLSGQLAVAQVVINRARSGRFASDVCAVVKQRGQFSFVHGGVIPAIDEGRAQYRTALAVAKVALRAAWDGPVPSALFFHARRVPASARMVRVAAIGNHVFYR